MQWYTFESNAEFRQIAKDVEDAVRARIRRQQALYEPGKRFRFLIWEGALYVRTCPREVHASRECIERRQNPHTRLPIIARPATKEEAAKLPWCGTCWG